MFLTLFEKYKPLEEESTVAFINKTVLMQRLKY